MTPSGDTAFDLPGRTTLAAIGPVPMVLPTRNHGLRRTLEYAVSRQGMVLNVQFEVDTLELLKAIVVAGLACTVLAKPAVLDELAAGTLVARRIASPRLQTKLVLATATRRPVTRGIQLVEQEIKTIVAQLLSEKADRYGLAAALG